MLWFDTKCLPFIVESKKYLNQYNIFSLLSFSLMRIKKFYEHKLYYDKKSDKVCIKKNILFEAKKWFSNSIVYTCCVCLEPIADKLKTSECGHHICRICSSNIEKNSKKTKTAIRCPMCRRCYGCVEGPCIQCEEFY